VQVAYFLVVAAVVALLRVLVAEVVVVVSVPAGAVDDAATVEQVIRFCLYS